MKSILLCFILFTASLPSISQCDKKVNWYGTKGEMYDQDGGLLDTKLDSVFFETDPQKIALSFKSDGKTLEGTVKEKTCDWKEPFKNGKTVYHTVVSIDGQTSNATFTIETKDGKTILWMDMEARKGRKFKIYIDGYEEIK